MSASALILSLTAVIVSIHGGIIFPDDEILSTLRKSSFIKNNITTLTESSFIKNSILSSSEEHIENKITEGLLNFTLSINNVVRNYPGYSSEKNVVYSPLSIAGALALVLLGAVGPTRNEIANVLGITPERGFYDTFSFHQQFGNLLSQLEDFSNSEDYVSFANGLFVKNHYPLAEIYKRVSSAIYKAKVTNVDYSEPKETRELINAWVSEKTNQKIPKALDEDLSEQSIMTIVNTLYFNGKWRIPFEGGTFRSRFYVDGGHNMNHIMVDMMSIRDNFRYYKDKSLECEIVGLPYKGFTTLYAVKPLDSNIQKLKKLESSLTPSILQGLIGEATEVDTFVAFPKMNFKTSISLKRILNHLGIQSLFDPTKANLALISDDSTKERGGSLNNNFKQQWQILNNNSESLKNPGIYANAAIHKVFMNITEAGTEAAAVTILATFRSIPTASFVANEPFFFFIRDDRSGIISFWGTVYEPTASSEEQ